MSAPDIGQDEIRAVCEVLRSGRVSMGREVECFEEAFASFIGARFAVAVSSGTAGLHLTMLAAGVGRNDLVVTTPFSFVASANCILYQGAIPVFVDVDPATGNLDPQGLIEAVDRLVHDPNRVRSLVPTLPTRATPGRLKSIVAVHALGHPVDMDPIRKKADEYDLVLIEDACEALGSQYRGVEAGRLGHAAVFGFYANKQITTGEGGMVVTDNSDWDRLFRSLRNQGRDVFDATMTHNRLGFNYRMDGLSAALGTAQLQRIKQLTAKRHQVARWYQDRLIGVDEVELMQIEDFVTRFSWFVMGVRIRPPFQRDRVMRRLAADGIPSRIYFQPIHLQDHFRERFGYAPGQFPVAERLAARSLALPFSSLMTEGQVETVCQVLKRALRNPQ